MNALEHAKELVEVVKTVRGTMALKITIGGWQVGDGWLESQEADRRVEALRKLIARAMNRAIADANCATCRTRSSRVPG